ncbi:MAG: serine/threonine-protein phosphatase [Crocosphaera sp.]|nr:serine/threonine-protein phosphatase [Crocosphaera sp.]
MYKYIKDRISNWLSNGEKNGSIILESGRIALSSSLGQRSENQDRTVFVKMQFSNQKQPSIIALVLCDGMGGMVAGGRCATLAVSAFISSLYHSEASKLAEKLQQAAMYANQTVHTEFKSEGGSTLSAIAFRGTDEYAAINVGDSRIYAVLKSGEIKQISTDDTLEEQLAEHNIKSPPPEFRQLVQFIGMGEGIIINRVDLQSFDNIEWLLLTSDGSHGITNDVFRALISHAHNAKETVTRLTQFSEWIGGKDNATAAILRTDHIFPHGKETSEIDFIDVFSINGQATFFPQPRESNGSNKPKLEPSNRTQHKTISKTASNTVGVKESNKPMNKSNRKMTKNTTVNHNKEDDEKQTPKVNIELSEEA